MVGGREGGIPTIPPYPPWCTYSGVYASLPYSSRYTLVYTPHPVPPGTPTPWFSGTRERRLGSVLRLI